MPTNTKALQVAEPAPFVAGKNKFINGDFGVWQRGTSISLSTATEAYACDRFRFATYGSTGTVSRETFTPGTAPVSGYEGTYFARLTNGSAISAWQIRQRIEDVRVFAGQTVTFSFWIKASVARPNTEMYIQYNQNFGTGGSTQVSGATPNAFAITTSWVRQSLTITLPSISGKTIGTNSYLDITFYEGTGAASSSVIDTWGWQLEAGSVATPFTPAGGGQPQAELALCQRYYWRWTATATYSMSPFMGYSISSGGIQAAVNPRVTMRTLPSSIDYSSGWRWTEYKTTYNDVTGFTLIGGTELGSGDGWFINAPAASGNPFTTGRIGSLTASNNASAYLGFSAEL